MTDDGARPQHAVFAGGGSGGHVFPGLAVADVLSGRGWTVSWMGRPRGMERDLVEAHGLAYDGVSARPLVGRGAWARAGALGTLAVSALAAAAALRRRRAKVVLGTGGYVCAPAIVAARWRRRPVVLLEPNAKAGTANRWLSRWASVAAVAYPESGSGLRCAARHTGVPVRDAFARVGEIQATAACRLLILGGSQGARQINELMPRLLGRLVARPLRVVHQAGPALVDEARAGWRAVERDGLEVEVVPFLEDVAGEMEKADLVVSRAGAITLAEICVAGRPSLLVPLAIAAAHQVDNARRLEEAGAAIVHLEGREADLAARLDTLLGDRPALAGMAAAARRLGRPRAAEEIADLVEEVAR